MTKKQEKQFVVRSKIWIENDDGKVAFGLGRFKMLEAVDRLGSMNLAATELSMSYRSVWCRIRESEDRIGQKLLVSKGKGSTLTPFARELMKKFTDLNAALKEDADEMFGNLL